jgi:hypothetical protein
MPINWNPRDARPRTIIEGTLSPFNVFMRIKPIHAFSPYASVSSPLLTLVWAYKPALNLLFEQDEMFPKGVLRELGIFGVPAMVRGDILRVRGLQRTYSEVDGSSCRQPLVSQPLSVHCGDERI